MDLIADIGATNSRFALLDDEGRIFAQEKFQNNEFQTLGTGVQTYLKHHPEYAVQRAALAVAAPILGDRVAFINRDWSFSQLQLKQDFQLEHLIIVNDFAAIARSLPVLPATAKTKVGPGDPKPDAPIVALGPGSGLGVSAIVPTDKGWTVIQGEGGHVTLGPQSDDEVAVLEVIRKRFGHCSAERVLSGPGLTNLHHAVSLLAHQKAEMLTPREVTTRAQNGDQLASQACELFFSLLGNVAGNLALTFGAHGGICIAGGIVPKMLPALIKSNFRERFENKGRYHWYLAPIPTYVITEPVPAFLGLRTLLGN